MGGSESKPIKEYSKEDVSRAVANLGGCYQSYCQSLIGNGVDGRLLDVLGSNEIEETLDDLDIANRLHRRVLLRELNRAKARGEFMMDTYNFSPSTPKADLKPYQSITDRCLQEYQQSAILAGVYLVLENGNQLSLDTKVLKDDGAIVTENWHCPRRLSLCSSIVQDGQCNQFYYKVLLPIDMRKRLFADSSPITFTGYILKDETGKREGMICMLERCSPSDVNDDNRQDFLRQLAEDTENQLMLRKQLLERRPQNREQRSDDSFLKISDEPETEIILPAHGHIIKPVLKSQVLQRLRKGNPFQYASEKRKSHMLPIFHTNMATEAEKAHLPLNFFDCVDQIACPRPPIPKNDMECSAIVESLALTEIEPDDAIAIYLKDMVKMATQVFGFPNAEITFRNHDTIFCLAGYGLNEEITKCANVFPAMKLNKDGTRFLWKMPRALAVCNFVMAAAGTFVLQDIAADESFQWLISGTPCRCYVGTAIKDSCGRAIAVLCMHDAKPRPDFEAAHEIQVEQLANLIAQSIENWALQRSIDRLEKERKRLRRALGKHIPPKGCATLVITDIEGGTDMWEANSVAMQQGRCLHDSIVKEIGVKNFGYEVKIEGYSFVLAFHDPLDAFLFALQTQMALYEADWPEDLLRLPHAKIEKGAFRGLRVKMAVHHGDIDPCQEEESNETKYADETMNITRNLLQLAHGGQILATSEIWDAASYSMGSIIEFPQVLDHGSHVVPKGETTREGVITKRIIQLVPAKIAYDYFSARKLSFIVPEQERHVVALHDPLPGRHFPPISSMKKISPSFHDAPFVDNEVTMAFVNLAAIDEREASSVVNLIGILLDGIPKFGGYQCQSEMLAFHRPLDAILFGLHLQRELAKRETLGATGGGGGGSYASISYACMHDRFLTMGPHRTTGRADYFGKIVNRAARLTKAVAMGSVCLGVVCCNSDAAIGEMEQSQQMTMVSHPSIESRFSGRKRLKGVPEEVSVYEFRWRNSDSLLF